MLLHHFKPDNALLAAGAVVAVFRRAGVAITPVQHPWLQVMLQRRVHVEADLETVAPLVPVALVQAWADLERHQEFIELLLTLEVLSNPIPPLSLRLFTIGR
jgi:hypothetical protein